MLRSRFPALARSVSRPASTAFRLPAHQTRLFSAYPALRVTSSVSSQPASGSIKEVKENAKQEVKKVTGDLAKAVSGGNDPKSTSQVHGGSLEELEESVGGLASIAGNVPKEAWVAGAAGFIPYIGTSLSTIYLARQVSLATEAGKNSTIDLDTALALLHHVELVQISYGAVILSFLGAIHWGFEFSKFGGTKGVPRYLMGIAPVVLGWPTLILPAQMALAAQWAAFTGVWYIDSRATARGWTPKWYSTYRFALTAVVGSCILLTMGATNYFTSGSVGAAAAKLKTIKTDKLTAAAESQEGDSPRKEGTVGGDISTDEGDDAYVKFTDEKKKAEEEEKAKEEEAKKKKEEDEKQAKAKKEEVEKKAKEARDKAEGKA